MGKVSQSGMQRRGLFTEGPRPLGQLVRGVVMATYVLDDPNHPATTTTTTDAQGNPVGVYCDVLVYSSKPAYRCYALPKVLVLQDRGGLHNGRVWKPKASTMDITGQPFDPDVSTQVSNMDGDHVLIGFIDDALNMPVILGGVPHPSHDAGVDPATALPGHRRQLVLADGDPDWFRHNGVVYGIDGSGNYVVDSRWGNDGTLDTTGAEPAPPTDGKGAQLQHLPMDAEHRTEWWDMADPTAPVSKSYQSIKKDAFELSLDDVKAWLQLIQTALEVKLDGGATLKAEGKDATASLTVGDGAKHAAIVEALQSFYASAIKGAFDNHTHPTGVGPSGPPTPKAIMDPWDTTINSTKLAFPNG